jgi:hypothetical protein
VKGMLTTSLTPARGRTFGGCLKSEANNANYIRNQHKG